MQPNNSFKNLPLEFWSNVKLLNQRLGYANKRNSADNQFIIPNVSQIKKVFQDENLNYSHLIEGNTLTPLGTQIQDYMAYRGSALLAFAKPNLMDKEQAKILFAKLRNDLNPQCPLPMNKQTGEKKDYAFFTCLINMLIEANKGDFCCNYDPKELTYLTRDNFPVRTLSRRVDGAFPKIKDPIAIWEIKEYYYTTTFGSRVADGVYETQLDGWELKEVENSLRREIKHYLMIDAYDTWWNKGRSYLCRLIDLMHMGLVTEVIFGKEIIERIPPLVNEWKNLPD